MTARLDAPAVPPVIPLAIGAAWLLAIGAEIGGADHFAHHDALIGTGLPISAALGVFLIAWGAMIAAMMLPSTVPMIRHFSGVARRQDRGSRAVLVFVGGYAVVWTAFGLVALIGDAALHQLVGRTPWLEARPWVIGGSVLFAAGLFQFSALKDRCLIQCRQPFAYLMRQRLRGVESPFRLGLGHGVFCLGCCWALMLLMFAVGLANLAWMAVLTAVMTYEKVGRRGAQLVPVAGVLLLAWGVVVFTHPVDLPGLVGGPH